MLRRFVLSPAIVIAVACMIFAMTIPSEARTRPRYGGTLRIELEGDPLQRDLLQRPDGMGWRLILDGLTEFDSQGTLRPSLAQRWASDNNDHRWQFWLRSGVLFQNGHPLNALAVVTSVQESCRLIACPWSGIHVAGQSVIFTSENPLPNLPFILAANEFLIRQRAEPTTDIDGLEMVIGTGPFRIKETSHGKLRLEANDDCWRGRPFLDAVEIYAHRSAKDQWIDLSQNKADIVEVRPGELRQARQQRLNVAASPPETLLALQVNNTRLTTQQCAAVALAVDRNALYQVIFQKEGEVSASLLPSSLSGYSFLFPAERDLSRAQAVRGGATPPPLTLSVDGSGAMQLAAERLALNLHDAGFAVKVMTPGANAQTIRQADLVLRALPLQRATPQASLEAMLRTIGLNQPVIAQDSTAAYQAERDYLNQHAVIPLLYLPRTWALSSQVRDMQFDTAGAPNLANLSLEEGP